MYFRVYNKNRAILDCHNKIIAYLGILLIILGILLAVINLIFLINDGYSSLDDLLPFVFPVLLLIIGYILFFHKTIIIVNHSTEKIKRQTKLLGIYKWTRNDWNMNEVEKFDCKFVKGEYHDDVNSPDYYEHYLQLSNGKKVAIFNRNQKCDDLIKEFNLYIKKNFSDNIKITCDD